MSYCTPSYLILFIGGLIPDQNNQIVTQDALQRACDTGTTKINTFVKKRIGDGVIPTDNNLLNSILQFCNGCLGALDLATTKVASIDKDLEKKYRVLKKFSEYILELIRTGKLDIVLCPEIGGYSSGDFTFIRPDGVTLDAVISIVDGWNPFSTDDDNLCNDTTSELWLTNITNIVLAVGLNKNYAVEGINVASLTVDQASVYSDIILNWTAATVLQTIFWRDGRSFTDQAAFERAQLVMGGIDDMLKYQESMMLEGVCINH